MQTGAFLWDGTLKGLGDDYAVNGINETAQIAGNKSKPKSDRTSSLPYDPTIYNFNGHNKCSVLDVANIYSRGARNGKERN